MEIEEEIRELRKKNRELEEENSRLREEKARIESEKKRIESEKEIIKSEIERIESEKERIEKEFKEFKALHASTVDNLRKALRIKPNSHKHPAHIGALVGHKGYSRHIPERIDEIKPLILKQCPTCKAALHGKVLEIRTRHVTDIKLISQAHTTQYQIERRWCPNCGRIVEAEVPGALPHARLGLKLMLLVMYLRLGLRLPQNKVVEYFETLHHIQLSGGEIVNILTQLAMAFGDHYQTLLTMVRLARVKHTDSTSWRINGRNYFAWVFIATGVVLYAIRKRNNARVPLAILGKAKNNMTLVVDRYAAYRTLAKRAGYLLQYCWSHILDDSKALAKNFGSEGRYVHRKLKEIYAFAEGLEHKASDEEVDQLKGMIIELTWRHYTHITVRRFVDRLAYRELEHLFRFTQDPSIDATNNISERELRTLVIIRKISNGSRSPRGANATA
ncbi:MAG: IS66 family transposase, partial [archaeon]